MPLVSAAYGRALVWAEELHRDQRRKGKPVPYISHLIAVSGLVWEDGGNQEQPGERQELGCLCSS